MPQQLGRHEALSQKPSGPNLGIVEPATTGDVFRLLVARRNQIMVWFMAFVTLGGIGLLLWWGLVPPETRGLLSLGFPGIERHEYPSGRPFTVEDIRSPDVLSRALDESGIDLDRISSKRLLAGIQITPMVPTDIQARWRRQEKDGSRRDDFKPSEFDVLVAVRGLDEEERARLFDALIVAYRETVRGEEIAANRRIPLLPEGDPGGILARSDPWDLPRIFLNQAVIFQGQLAASLEDARRMGDLRGEIQFREIGFDLDAWRKTRLESVQALVYHERLVGDERLMEYRLKERIADLDIKLQRVHREIEETERLLTKVDRPNSVVAGQGEARENASFVDAAVLERIVKNDYIGPVVRKASDLSGELGALTAGKATAQRELDQLRSLSSDPSARKGTKSEALAVLDPLLKAAITDFNGIARQYLVALDEFLQSQVLSRVRLREGPVQVRFGVPLGILIGAIVAGSALMAMLMVLVRGVLFRDGAANGE